MMPRRASCLPCRRRAKGGAPPAAEPTLVTGGSPLGTEAPELGDEELPWCAGQLYALAHLAPLWAEPEATGKAASSLQQRTEVLLVRLGRATDGRRMGLVRAKQPRTQGWLALADAAGGTRRGWSSLLVSVASAWKMEHFYRTVRNAALQAAPALDSLLVRDLAPGEAVRLLGLDLTPDCPRGGGPRPSRRPSARPPPTGACQRLRARVRTEHGEEGWVNLETAEGEDMLELMHRNDSGAGAWGRSEVSSNRGPQPARDTAGLDHHAKDAEARRSSTPQPLPLPPETYSRLQQAAAVVAPQPATPEAEVQQAEDDESSGETRPVRERTPPPSEGQLPGFRLPEEGAPAEDSRSDNVTPRPEVQAWAPDGCDCRHMTAARGLGPPLAEDARALDRWVHAVYARYNPAKLGRVEVLLAEHVGREEELIELIAQKYRVRPLPKSLLSSP